MAADSEVAPWVDMGAVSDVIVLRHTIIVALIVFLM